MEAQCQRLEVRSEDGGSVLFAADEDEVVMTSEKFTVTGKNPERLMLKQKMDPQFCLFWVIFIFILHFKTC